MLQIFCVCWVIDNWSGDEGVTIYLGGGGGGAAHTCCADVNILITRTWPWDKFHYIWWQTALYHFDLVADRVIKRA